MLIPQALCWINVISRNLAMLCGPLFKDIIVPGGIYDEDINTILIQHATAYFTVYSQNPVKL